MGHVLLLLATLLAGGCAAHRPRAVVTATDRTAADRALDAGRRPEALLRFIDVRRGMHVAELGAGGGYTTELLARSVGENGVVYAQNSQFILDRFAAKSWAERLARPAMRNVVRLDRDFDDPLPQEVHDLDRVWMNVDRRRMNDAVFRALRPGGLYVVIDHSARPGAGYAEVRTLHRIEEVAVRREVEEAGFRLARESDFLRNPTDPRDWNDSPSAAGERRGTSDRFALAFVKPAVR